MADCSCCQGHNTPTPPVYRCCGNYFNSVCDDRSDSITPGPWSSLNLTFSFSYSGQSGTYSGSMARTSGGPCFFTYGYDIHTILDWELNSEDHLAAYDITLSCVTGGAVNSYGWVLQGIVSVWKRGLFGAHTGYYDTYAIDTRAKYSVPTGHIFNVTYGYGTPVENQAKCPSVLFDYSDSVFSSITITR